MNLSFSSLKFRNLSVINYAGMISLPNTTNHTIFKRERNKINMKMISASYKNSINSKIGNVISEICPKNKEKFEFLKSVRCVLFFLPTPIQFGKLLDIICVQTHKENHNKCIHKFDDSIATDNIFLLSVMLLYYFFGII